MAAGKYRLEFHRAATKDVKKFSKHLQQEIRNRHLPLVIQNPFASPTLKGELHNYRKYSFTYRKTDYRVVYRVEKEVLTVFIVMIPLYLWTAHECDKRKCQKGGVKTKEKSK